MMETAEVQTGTDYATPDVERADTIVVVGAPDEIIAVDGAARALMLAMDRD